jgi:hypothetical protein
MMMQKKNAIAQGFGVRIWEEERKTLCWFFFQINPSISCKLALSNEENLLSNSCYIYTNGHGVRRKKKNKNEERIKEKGTKKKKKRNKVCISCYY